MLGSRTENSMPFFCLFMPLFCRLTIAAGGLLISTVGGHYFIKWAKEEFWRLYVTGVDTLPEKAKLPKDVYPERGPSEATGFVERFLDTCALALGAWQWIGVWMAMKIAARWKINEDNLPRKIQSANIHFWLIGSGISLVFGYVGAWIAIGRPPCLK
jgi:hypothetical protein